MIDPTRITLEILEDMRVWISDCEWGEEEDIDPWKMNDKEIIRGIQRHFGGGIDAFMATY